MVLLSADQQVEELKAKNEALQAESTLLYKKVRANEILFDQAKAENAKLEAENARLKEELKRPIAEDSCPDCGETIYFYTLGPIRCGCGGAELALMVNTTILEE